jgi:opacity protein-like surface antigen
MLGHPVILPDARGDFMKTILAALLLAAGLASAAAAQTVREGTYDVAGTNLDGSPYEGTAVITLTSETTCSIEWSTGGTTSAGICMLHDNAFAAGYVLGDNVGLIVYEVKDDGVLDGVWTISGENGAGTEVLTRRN